MKNFLTNLFSNKNQIPKFLTDNQGKRPSNYWPNFLAACIIIVFISITLYSFQDSFRHLFKINSQFQTSLDIFGRLLLILTTGFSCGWLFGFVFGIPKTSPSNNQSSETEYRINTNLEDISDWLTKVLIGVTLAQIPVFYQNIISFVIFLQENTFQGVIFSVLVSSFIFGTVWGYLWARAKLKSIDKFYGGFMGHSSQLEIDISAEENAEKAFSLIIKNNPSSSDYKQAKQLLNDAISQRGEWNKYRHSTYVACYNFLRAICQIKLHEKGKNEDIEKIVEDLKVVQEAKLLKSEPDIIYIKDYNRLIIILNKLFSEEIKPWLEGKREVLQQYGLTELPEI